MCANTSNFVVATLEIKSSVSASSPQINICRASVNIVTCIVGDERFNEMIPEEHVGQVVQQMCGVECHFEIYVRASEAGVLHTVVSQI